MEAVVLYCAADDEAVRGDWEAACLAAGFPAAQKLTATVRAWIVDSGGVPPAVASVATPPVTLPPALPDPTDDSVDWRAEAQKLLPVWNNIAAGLVDASPTQRQVLQDIMNRAYGRPGSQTDAKPDGMRVVVLPMLGLDSAAQICPNCLARLEDAK